MQHPITGIILAGGESTRLAGANKAFLKVGGRRMIDRIYEVLASLCDEIIIVTNSPEEYLDYDARIVSDIYDIRCSLSGIYTGLFYAQNRHSFVTACDSPFLNRKLVETLISYRDDKCDVVIPSTAEGYQPLCALYSNECLNAMKVNLNKGILKIQRSYRKGKMKKIEEKVLRSEDPELYSFFNINTLDDLIEAEGIYCRLFPDSV